MFSDLDLKTYLNTYSKEEKLCIKWKNRIDTVVSTFQECRENENFTDVTLIGGNKQFKAHKMVLSSCSPYFDKLFRECNADNTTIILQDVEDWQLKLILDFIYIGQIDINCEQISCIVDIGKMLQIKGLSDNSEEPIKESKRKISDTAASINKRCKIEGSELDQGKIERMNSAIAAITSQNMSFSQASKFYNIAKMTLYDNILGKRNRNNILDEIGLNEEEYRTVCQFCSNINRIYDIKTYRSIREIVDFAIAIKRRNDPSFTMSETERFRWWWAFSKKYGITSIYKTTPIIMDSKIVSRDVES